MLLRYFKLGDIWHRQRLQKHFKSSNSNNRAQCLFYCFASILNPCKCTDVTNCHYMICKMFKSWKATMIVCFFLHKLNLTHAVFHNGLLDNNLWALTCMWNHSPLQNWMERLAFVDIAVQGIYSLSMHREKILCFVCFQNIKQTKRTRPIWSITRIHDLLWYFLCHSSVTSTHYWLHKQGAIFSTARGARRGT